MKFIIVIVLIVGLLPVIGCKEKGNMPAFPLRLRDSTSIITSDQIPTGSPVLFMFFDPDCEHCQQETTELLANINELKNVQLYFITVSGLDRMRVFYNYYHLADYPNIVLGQDFNFTLLKSYQLPTTPSVLLYNKHKTLKVIFKGYSPIEEILAEVNSL